MQGKPITVYRHDVEAISGLGRHHLGEVGGQGAQPRPLSRIDGPQGRTESPLEPPFDLHEDEGCSVQGDDIDLASGEPGVPAQDAVPKALEIAGGAILSLGALG